MTNRNEPDSRALKAFITMAESNSLSDAARKAGVTQPAMSRTLKNLEKLFGTSLVERRTKPVKLTAAGHILKRNADLIVGDLRRLNAKVRENSAKGLVQCRMGLVTSCSEVFGSSLLGTLNKQTQYIAFRSGLTPPLTEDFLNRDIDILISDETLDGVDKIERFKLFKDPLFMVLPKKPTMPRDMPMSKILESLPLIKYGRHSYIGGHVEVALRRMKLSTEVRYETDDTHTLVNFVKDGRGWGVLSHLCLVQVLHLKDHIICRELDKGRHGRDIYLICRKGELGSLPNRIAKIVRQIFIHDVFPQLKQMEPWMTLAHFGI